MLTRPPKNPLATTISQFTARPPLLLPPPTGSPNRQVGLAITGIHEVVADPLANAGQFGFSLEIRVVTGSDDTIEQCAAVASMIFRPLSRSRVR